MFFAFYPTVTFYVLPQLGVIPANQKRVPPDTLTEELQT